MDNFIGTVKFLNKEASVARFVDDGGRGYNINRSSLLTRIKNLKKQDFDVSEEEIALRELDRRDNLEEVT